MKKRLSEKAVAFFYALLVSFRGIIAIFKIRSHLAVYLHLLPKSQRYGISIEIHHQEETQRRRCDISIKFPQLVIASDTIFLNADERRFCGRARICWRV